MPRPGEPQGEQSAVEPSVRVEHVTADDGGESGASRGTAAASRRSRLAASPLSRVIILTAEWAESNSL